MLVLAFVVLFLPACDSIPESAKPDIHLTFDLHNDGSNAVMVEVAVHPLVDPLLGPALVEAQRAIADEPSASVRLTETKRAGRVYNALVVDFNSIGDLNAFVNTPHLLTGIVSLVAPDVTIPSPFAEFEAWHDPGSRSQPFGLRARLDPATTSALAGIKLTTHVILPGKPSDHNALSVSDRTLNWEMVSGEPLQINAVAGRTAAIDLQLILIVAGGALVLLVLIGFAIWALRRRRISREADLEFGAIDGW
jgi:hypothetical protein